jgi:hypothetical protein
MERRERACVVLVGMVALDRAVTPAPVIYAWEGHRGTLLGNLRTVHGAGAGLHVVNQGDAARLMWSDASTVLDREKV